MADERTGDRRMDFRHPYFAVGVVFVLVGLTLPLAASSNPSGVAFTVLGFVFMSMAYRPALSARSRSEGD